MKIRKMQKLLLGIGFICACRAGAFAGTYANITIDGGFLDWAGVLLAYTAPPPAGPTSAIQYENISVANDNLLEIVSTVHV